MTLPTFGDRVQETFTTTGTGTISLGGAVTGYQAFSAAVADAGTCYYAASDGTNWEVGLGTYTSSGDTLARTTILASSNSGSAVSWAAGTKNIWLDIPASWVTNNSAVAVQNVVTGSRAINTVYHNTTGKPMLVNVSLNITAGTTDWVVNTDSSSTPTTTVAAAVVASSAVTYTNLTFMVLPGNYYEIVASGGASTIYTWTEWN